jgi:streptogramin lyase
MARSFSVVTLAFVATLLLTVFPQGVAAQTNVGSIAVGYTTATPVTVTVQITATGTVSSIEAVTQGDETREFLAATGGSGNCAVGVVSIGGICTVNVTFTPNFSGARNGAIVLEDALDNRVLGTAYVTGTGTGPQIIFPSPLPTAANISGPTYYGQAVAVDAAGYVYGADNTGILYKATPAVNATTGQVTYPTSTAIYTSAQGGLRGVALDGAGNVYIADASPAVSVLTLLPNGTYAAPVPIGSGWNEPIGVAVDGAGSVFVADAGIPGVYEITLTSSGYSAPVALPAPSGGWDAPLGVAVDGSDNVYVVDQSNNAAYELSLLSGSYATPVVIASSDSSLSSNYLDNPNGVAVDGNGDVIISSYDSESILALTRSGSGFTEQTIAGSAYFLCVAVDGAGNVYSGANPVGGSNVLEMYQLANPPALNFGSDGVGYVGTIMGVTVKNIGNAALDLSGISFPTDFPEALGRAGECSSTPVAAGGNCALTVSFTPSVASLNATQPLTESVTFGSNAFPVTQTIAVSGTATKATPWLTLTASANPSELGNPITFTAVAIGPTDIVAPTGTMAFALGSTAISGCAAVLMTGGVATCTTSTLALGSSNIVAAYSGDAVYTASQSSQILAENIVAAPVASAPPVTSAGAVNAGSTGTATVNITFSTPVTLGGIAVLTQGNPNLDFTLANTQAASGACVTGQAYSAKATCTVTVTFTPQFAGLRSGAVILTDNASPANVIGTAYVSGTSTGAQIAFLPGTLSAGLASTPINGNLVGMAVDGSGNIYVADDDYGVVWEIALSNGVYSAPSVLGGGTRSSPTLMYDTAESVAVDGAGNIYVADDGNNDQYGPAVYQIVPLPGGTYAQNYLGSGWEYPIGVAVDANGDVYVLDAGDGLVSELIPSNGSYTQTTIPTTGLTFPLGIAVDAGGNVYLVNAPVPGTDNPSSIFKLTLSGSSYKQSSLGSDLLNPDGIAVDVNGSVYVADRGSDVGHTSGDVAKLTPQANGAYLQSTLVSKNQLGQPLDVVLDGAGNLYVLDTDTQNVYKLDVADPPGPVTSPLTFQNTPLDWTSTDSPNTFKVENIGNAALTLSALTYPPDFPEAVGVTTDCAAGMTVAANGACTLSIDFTPTASLGANTSQPLAETVSLTSNAINANGAQTISVTGTELQASASVTLTSSVNPSWVGNPITFTALVAGGSGTLGVAPAGTVSFTTGNSSLCASVTLSTVTGTNGSTASCTTSAPAAGMYSIVASFVPGNTANVPAASGSMNETILANAPPTGPFGDTSVGTANIGSPLGPIPVTINFNVPATLGAIEVLTQGAPNLDFTDAGGGTCTIGQTYGNQVAVNIQARTGIHSEDSVTGNPASCTVNVSFSPQFAGLRSGAVVLIGSFGETSSSVIGTGYLQGTGVGPQTIFAVPTEVESCEECIRPDLVFKRLTADLPKATPLGSIGIAAEFEGDEQLDYLPGSQSAIDSGWSYPYGIAVDGLGNVYIADGFNSAVIKETYSKNTTTGVVTYTSSSLPTTDPYGWELPVGVAVDGAGNVYVSDADDELVVMDTLQPDGSYVPSMVDPSSDYCYPVGVAVDGSGNVYVADEGGCGSGGVYKETLLNGGVYVQSPVDTTSFEYPGGIAVDGSGNVYVTANSEGGASVVEENLQSNGSYTVSFINGNWDFPIGIAVDDNGNVYVADAGEGVVVRETPSNGGYTAVNIGEWFSPYELALSPSGNLYVTDDGNNEDCIGCFPDNNVVAAARLSKGHVAASRSTHRPLAAARSLSRKTDPAAIYGGGVTGTISSVPSVYMADFADPPSMSFATTAYLATSTDSPQTVIVDDFGNAQLNFTSLVYSADFPELAGTVTDCTATIQLPANSFCTLTIDFSPIALSTTSLSTLLSEDVDITTNALNTKNGDAQAVPVSGTETQPGFPLATPTFTPTPGPYTSTQTVLISEATEGAAIYYTTDGTAPVVGASDTTLYTSAGVSVSSSETIEAIAVLAGYINSAVATGAYTINSPTAATPTFTPTPGSFTSTQTVLISDATGGAAIYYTTDGTAPVVGASDTTLYTSAGVTVSSSETIEAIAVLTGYINSAVASGTYTIGNMPVVATPTFSVRAAGATTQTDIIVISDATAGAAIYYTTDGKAPVVGASDTTLYTSAGVTVTSDETIQAIGVLAGYTNSNVASYIVTFAAGDFTVNATNAAATVQPGGSGVFTFTVTPTGGATTFPSGVTLSVSGLPAGATYVLSPASIAPGAGTTTVTLTFHLSQASAAARPERGVGSHLASRLAPLSLALLLLPFVGRLRKSGKRFSRMLAVLLVLSAGAAAMAGLSGCGSTIGFFGQAPRSYTVTLTGTMGGLTHASNATLTVE